MSTASSSKASIHPFVIPAVDSEGPVLDGLPETSSNRPWSLSTFDGKQDGGPPSTSKSWPPVSKFMTVATLGNAIEQLGAVDCEGEGYDEDTFDVGSSDCAVESAWSPAAAFLSGFYPEPAPAPDATGNIIAGYTLGPTIGYGGFSTIKQATSSSGGIVAVKIVRHSAFNHLPQSEKARQRSRLSHEGRVWVSLSHENILPLFDSHRTSEATYLITLYCPSGSLLDILRREGTPALEQTDAGCMFRQVVKALQYLHETMNLVHGDVKLENVLVDESGVCRLADFGLTRRIGGDSSQVSSDGEDGEESTFGKAKRDRSRSRRSGTSALPVHLSLMRHGPQRHRNSAPPPFATPPPTHPDHVFQPGSLHYAAPELLLPHAHSGDACGSRPIANPAQDMWALGVLLYALLTGMLPFRDPFEPRLQMKILRGTYEIPPAIGSIAESVLKGCLESNVPERWTIAMVEDAAWGIGYGNVDLDPSIREEQRTQSRSRSPAHSLPQSEENLNANLSSCSISPSGLAYRSPSRGRSSRVQLRSQSRSPSPSVAPRTPDDDDDDAGYIRNRRRNISHLRQRNSDDVQIVVGDDVAQWDSHDRLYTGEHGHADMIGLPLEETKIDRQESLRGRPNAPIDSRGAVAESRKKSQSRTRSWSLNGLPR